MPVPRVHDKLFTYVAWIGYEVQRFLWGLAPGRDIPLGDEPFPVDSDELRQRILDLLTLVKPGTSAADVEWRGLEKERFIEEHRDDLAEAVLLGYADLYRMARRARVKRMTGAAQPLPGERFSCCGKAPGDGTHHWGWRHLLTMADERSDMLEDLAK